MVNMPLTLFSARVFMADQGNRYGMLVAEQFSENSILFLSLFGLYFV